MIRHSAPRRNWVRLDNASNIFLAARSDTDPKVFRISAEMDHDVDPVFLQEALDATYDRYPLYHAVLRQGVFWYYLQDSDLRPLVTAEDQPTCAPIYRPDHRNLLFRVVFHRRRIVLEVFHALSDGTGALWFLNDLVTEYIRLQDPPGPRRAAGPGDVADASPDPEPAEPQILVDSAVPEQPHGLVADSFAHYFRRRRRNEAPVAESDFNHASTPAAPDSRPEPESIAIGDRARFPAGALRGVARLLRLPRTSVYRVKGTRTPDNRTRAVELTMPAAEVLALARDEGVALTMFLTGVFFESIRRSAGSLGRARTLSASAPVNLRQFFPSTSPRNFFAIARVEHTYGDGGDDLGSVCRQLEAQFRSKASPEALGKKLRRFIRLEGLLALRILPRPFKDVILRLINWGNNRGLTVAVSNMGRVILPEPADSRVGRMLLHVSAARPQICAMTHAGLLTISFSSPFTETAHVREFARLLTERGVAVTVAAARVTETELAQAP